MNTKYTNEQDKWLNANVNAMDRCWQRISEAFNGRFGTTKTPDALRLRSSYLLIQPRHSRYSEEEDRWILDHSYVDRRTMTKLFNDRFGAERSKRSIEQHCSKLKAYKLIEVTGEYKSMCVWTDEIDKWLMENTRRFRDNNEGLVRELNHTFGTRFTVRAVNYRRWSLGVKTKGFYEEEDRWLLERCDIHPVILTEEFNRTFKEHRSAPCIEKHLSRLIKKSHSDEQNGTSDESIAKRAETTPPEENGKGEVVL